MGRTLNQAMADSHEADIADWIRGSLQKSSGNQWHQQADAKNSDFVPHPVTGDGKATMQGSVSIKRADWEKLVEQTFGQNPALFHRFYRPGERLTQVDLDLVTISVEFFCELLEDARKWKEHEAKVQYIRSRVVALNMPEETDTGNDTGCDCCR